MELEVFEGTHLDINWNLLFKFLEQQRIVLWHLLHKTDT